jgi:hypothetical protein
MSPFRDSIERFHEMARDARGLDDFGEDDYRVALDELCRSLDEDASLNEVGVYAFEDLIVSSLQARLLVEEGHRVHPTARDAQIDRPLFIVGLPRTGTTAIHHSIAQDPRIQSLEHWLARAPKPRPPRADWANDADYRFSKGRIDAIYERSPDMRAIHGIDVDLPDECWNLFSQNFSHSSWQANADVARYAAWWAGQDMTPTYRRHHRNVQLIGHREPHRRWLFKDATHLFDLEALLTVYPDALIVQTHRDPLAVIPSVCSLCWSSRSPMNEASDREAFARSTLELWERGLSNAMRVRNASDSAAFFDVSFERFVTNPLSTIREIYRAFDLEWTDGAEAAIRGFAEAHPKGELGEHRYHVDDWGLDPDEISERFEAYSRTYDVKRSG